MIQLRAKEEVIQCQSFDDGVKSDGERGRIFIDDMNRSISEPVLRLKRFVKKETDFVGIRLLLCSPPTFKHEVDQLFRCTFGIG